MFVTPPFEFDSSVSAISGNRERLTPQSILHLSPFHHDLRMTILWYLNSWKNMMVKLTAKNAMSRDTCSQEFVTPEPALCESMINR